MLISRVEKVCLISLYSWNGFFSNQNGLDMNTEQTNGFGRHYFLPT